MIDYGDGHLTVRAIKRSIDGALGSRGAWLLEPYSDKPDSTGLNTDDGRPISRDRAAGDGNGYQLCVHAIGDRANRETLNIFEQAFKANPDEEGSALARRARAAPQPAGHPALRPARRDRVDAGHPLHVGRAVRAGAARREARGGRRLRLAEADEERRRSSANGTDAPVEDVDPIASYYATVSRKTKDGQVFYPGSAHEPHGSAEVLHAQRRVRGVRGRHRAAR